MTALVEQDPVAAVGLLAGAIGVSIAFYLAFVTRHDVPWRYTFAFFLLGAALVFSHTDPVAPPLVADGLRLVVLAVVLAGEVAGFVWVLRHTPAERPRQVARDLASVVPRLRR